jgi:hypothetical protein
MDRVTVAPFLVVFFAGLLNLPALNIFKICAWNAGTSKVDPWRIRAGASVQKVAQALRTWFASLFTRRSMAFACLAVLIALLAMQLSAGHGHGHVQVVEAATLPIATLRQNRMNLLREAEGLMKDGKFENDEKRQAYDKKLDEVAAIELEIRTVEGQAPAVPAAVKAEITPEMRTQIVNEERARVADIRTAVRVAGLGSLKVRVGETEVVFGDDLVGRGVSIETARKEIFEKLATRSAENPTSPHIAMGEDAHDKFQRGAMSWLLVKGGVAANVARAEKVEVSTIDPGEFRGLTLLDLARMSLERAGRSTRGMDKMRLVSEAFMLRATQSVSDFTTLLENTMNKVLQTQYSITPDTWRKFCNVSSNPDFRAANRYRWGNLSVLDSLTEDGEFKNKALSDAEKATLTVATKGNTVNISRQMIVNDDMGAFTRLPMMLGRAAALSVEVDVYATLALNSGDGPTLSDGIAMFHTSSHGANKTTGAALSAAALDLDRVAMASQKEPNGNDFTDLRPAILVLPVGLGGQAKVINGSIYDPDTVANKAQMKPNLVVGLFREIVDTPRITGTRRYLFADPSIAPVLEVAFLEGQTSPVLETKDQWSTDGAAMKVRFDYGVGGVDFRGAVTNAGV